ncbi:uncharacterized protein [Musca autumnalis]|uniref:uncharacterized protein n=1 Tax=Musca autumnalis TaxID=221902 RepID=UPI003CF50D6C
MEHLNSIVAVIIPKSSGPQSYTCVSTSIEITFLRAMGLCHEYNLQIADELIRNCLRQNGRKHETFVKPERQLLHYTLETTLKSSGCAAAVVAADNSQLSQMLYVIVVAVFWCWLLQLPTVICVLS